MIEPLSNKYLSECNKILNDNDFKSTNLLSENAFTKKICYIKNNVVLGFIQYSIYYDRAELDYIVVEKKHRNKGVASSLIKFMIEECKKNKCKNITLEVKCTNNSAIKLYEKHNFIKVATRKNYYKNIDAYLFELKLEGE
ncbi:MAG: GNAT family N-acetyltransferase [Bacilli bacterium]|nr:GNAT family N-acetyltransferase [Bacilli bacterium]